MVVMGMKKVMMMVVGDDDHRVSTEPKRPCDVVAQLSLTPRILLSSMGYIAHS